MVATAANEVLLSMTGDRDVGVRKTVVKNVSDDADKELRARIDEMSRQDPEQSIRQISTEVLQRMRQP
jgi:hypothetical protein